MSGPPFERSVFVNCPFDEPFAPLLQAIAFCITDLGFFPRLAPENADNSANRLDRIIKLIRGSKYAIHDLSRCKSSAGGEYARLNMPFELGLDHACARFGDVAMRQKAILVLEETRYDYQRSLSDISGWDIQAHEGDYIGVVRIVSSWLVRQAKAEPIGAEQDSKRLRDVSGVALGARGRARRVGRRHQGLPDGPVHRRHAGMGRRGTSCLAQRPRPKPAEIDRRLAWIQITYPRGRRVPLAAEVLYA